MVNIKFLLEKNKDTIIYEEILGIYQNNKLMFNLNNDKYTITKEKFIKETKDNKIVFDFLKREAMIVLKENNMNLYVSIEIKKFVFENSYIEIIYRIETEDDTYNCIKIEYK